MFDVPVCATKGGYQVEPNGFDIQLFHASIYNYVQKL